MTSILKVLAAAIFLLLASAASAAVCTSVSAGNWSQAARWSCGHVPLAADTVVIANNVTLNGSYTIAGLTVNSGATLTRSGTRTLTITGNLQVDGTVNASAAGTIRFSITGASSIISGSGTINNVYTFISGAAVSVAAGSSLNYTGSSILYTGRTTGGNALASVLTINGTINSTVSATVFLRLYANSTVVGSTGVINATPSQLRYYNNTSRLTNNGSVSLRSITRNNAANVWTQGVNSSLTIAAASTVGVFNANASGNTVTFNGTSAVLPAASSTYWNVAGSIFPAACPSLSAYTILGSAPCTIVYTQTRSPGACVNEGSGVSWQNSVAPAATLSGPYASGGANAYAGLTAANNTSKYLKCTSYGFNIPAGATISGIRVDVRRSASANNTIRDNSVRLVKDVSGTATIQSNADRASATMYTNSYVVAAHGGATDLWSNTWLTADINTANFGAAISTRRTSGGGGSRTARIDYMPITVSYTLAAVPDHIQISHSGSALTCSPQYVTITACADAACTMLYTAGGLSVTLAPGGLTYTIGTSGINSAATVQQSTAGLASLGATSSPAAINPTTCLNTVNGAIGCTNAMMFNSAGFLITAPNHVSCTNANISIEAVQQGVSTNRCVPAYANVARPVSLSMAYSNPTTGTKVLRDVNNGSNITTTASPHSLNFDATGKAILSVSYPDAGQLTLTANDTAPTGATLTGNGTFIAAPAAFAFSGVTAAPIKAGNNFNATVTAQTGTGAACTSPATAANFGKESPAAQTATISFSKCQPTGIAASNGAFSGSATFNNGVANITNLNWSEAGNGDLVASNSGYLGSGLNISGTTGSGGTACGGGAGNVGTFIPDHFDTVVTDGCAGCGFTYSGQPFSVTITARNGLPLPTTTQNYDGTVNTTPNFAHAVTLVDANASTTGVFGVSAVPMGVAVNGAGTVLTVPASDFVAGVASLNNVPVYTFNSATTAPVTLRMRATDSAYTAASSNGFVEGTAQIRSGRMKVSNAYGSELLPLSLNITTQYYQSAANGWVTSSSDSSTTFSTALSTAGGNVAASIYQGPLTLANVNVSGPSNGQVAGGVRTLTLAAPGAGNSGAVDLSMNAPVYMLSGNNTAAVNPSVPGRATFGVFNSGKSEIIYQRESY